MPGLIGHVVFGKQVHSHCQGSIIDSAAFWNGTLFPDIRYVAPSTRHPTHPTRVAITNIVGANDFTTGMRIHTWLDDTRSHYLQQHGVKELLPWHPLTPQALTLLEDEYIYDQCSDWEGIQHCLHTIYDQEQELICDLPIIEQWHRALRDYFDAAPTDTTRLALGVSLGLSKTVAQECNQLVHQLRTSAAASELLEGWQHHLRQLLH